MRASLALGMGMMLVLAGVVGCGGAGGGGGGETFGSLDVRSTPSGAQIFLDGQNRQRVTPTIIEDVPAGTHTVTLSRMGYADWSRSDVVVATGQCCVVDATLIATSSVSTVYGFVVAPNGSYPIINATATVLGTDPLLSDLTDNNGMFQIDNVPVGLRQIRAEKGSFVVTTTVDVVAGYCCLPEPIRLGLSPGAEAVKMAVAAGAYDTIEDILEDVGFSRLSSPTEPGTGYVLYGDSAWYGSIQPVLSNPSLLSQYQIVFLNCGTDEAPTMDAVQMQNLRDWVAAGGSVYCSDWAYRFVEAGWPAAIDWYGDDNNPNVARDGVAEEVIADVLDETLQAALASTTARINFNLGAWVIADAAGAGTETLMKANVQAYSGLALSALHSHGRSLPTRSANLDAVPLANRPILMRFYSGSGTVIYTCFHNEAQSTGDMDAILYCLVFGL